MERNGERGKSVKIRDDCKNTPLRPYGAVKGIHKKQDEGGNIN